MGTSPEGWVTGSGNVETVLPEGFAEKWSQDKKQHLIDDIVSRKRCLLVFSFCYEQPRVSSMSQQEKGFRTQWKGWL